MVEYLSINKDGFDLTDNPKRFNLVLNRPGGEWVSDRVWPASMVYFNKRLIVFQVKNFK
jgi:hypothetical protein